MIRNITGGLIILAVVFLNFRWGSPVTWLLTAAIAGSIAYYVLWIGIENHLNRERAGHAGLTGDNRKKFLANISSRIVNTRALLSFALLTLVFFTSVITLKTVLQPGGKKPWHLNTDYHALAHKGFRFTRALTVQLPSTDQEEVSGNVKINRSEQGATLQFNRFYQPAFAEVDKQYTPINNVFPGGFSESFVLQNATGSVSVVEAEKKKGWMGRKRIFQVVVQLNDPQLSTEENIPIPFTGSLEVPYRKIEEGMLLYNLFLNAEVHMQDPETYRVLELLLRKIGNTYLLANYAGESVKWTIFPGKAFMDAGYRVSYDGQPVEAQTQVEADVRFDQHFFLGFRNQREAVSIVKPVQTRDQNAGTALVFDFPPYYRLTGPEGAKPGAKNIRFLTNSLDGLINGELGEGFYFNNYGWEHSYKIDGSLDFYDGHPGTSLEAGVLDNRKSLEYQPVKQGEFNLQSSDSGVSFLFHIRDFSKNGFALNRLVLFAALLYLAFLLVMVLVPGKNLARIEPVIFSVIYTLVILRLILLWRIATFPPLEAISKGELENTLLMFDYRWLINWPVPLTVVWVLLFLAALAVYRLYGERIRQMNGERLFFLPGEKVIQWVNMAAKKFQMSVKQDKWNNLNWTYGIFLFVLALAFFINKRIIEADRIIRIISILIPVLLYIPMAKRANAVFEYSPFRAEVTLGRGFTRFIHRFLNNPTAWLTILSILYFSLTDRGFAVLFILFVLLKNIFLNFLKKPYDSRETTLTKMLTDPANYWMYGVIALAVYLMVLGFKGLFYYLLTYKLLVIGFLLAALVLLAFMYHPKSKPVKFGMAGLLALFIILAAIPASRTVMDNSVAHLIRHVQYRASIIHQPIYKMLEANPYSSFQTRKIIETAENQWFINSYIDKPFDNSRAVNLRNFSKVGVNYSTQTRDVVVARFIVGEWGHFAMYLILLLCLLPLVIYLISYKITDRDKPYRLLPATYGGLLPLLMLFSISLFVWLTSTNRFVFFGQDFPFLSITSRLSTVLPLALFGLTLIQAPEVPESRKMNLRVNVLRFGFFFVLIALFALTTVIKNEIKSDYFAITVDKTRRHINNDLNGIMATLQDSLQQQQRSVSYEALMRIVAADARYRDLLSDSVSDAYTRSIFELLMQQPASGFRLDNPLYIQYDNGRYIATYNEHLYTRPPVEDAQTAWRGKITEQLGGSASDKLLMNYNDTTHQVVSPYYKSDVRSSLQIGIIPSGWLAGARQPQGIINIMNAARDRTELFLYKAGDNNVYQNAATYVSNLSPGDVASVQSGNRRFSVSFSGEGSAFAFNKWVNGRYRTIYPQRENNFWVRHLAECLRASYGNDSLHNADMALTLDYNLHQVVQDAINQYYAEAQANNRRFKFSAMAADGHGDIRLMAGFVTNRKNLDPNDRHAISLLEQQHFFFSNNRNERDQWGNPNLLPMQLGPGSSIKPLVAAVTASQVNAGWENLAVSAPQLPEYTHYAGYKMLKPWKNTENLSGDITMPVFLEASSNFYESTLIFLGSYPKNSFATGRSFGLTHLLNAEAGKDNTIPVIRLHGKTWYLPHFTTRKETWPVTDLEEKKAVSYFGNQQSVLANGFEVNANLSTKDKDKEDLSPRSYVREQMMDSIRFAQLQQHRSGNFIWCFPEPSSFMQSFRSFPEISANFNLGFKTVSLGGTPFEITPAKMLEMYLRLFTQNRAFRLHVTPARENYVPWQVDSSWNNETDYHGFLAENIFTGMRRVINGGMGTGRALAATAAAHPNLYFYAKTGTINEEGSQARDSRRLVVLITDRELENPVNIGPHTKTYGIFFTVENNHNFDWELINRIIQDITRSQSFNQYFNR